MIIIEAILVTVLICTCIYVTITDLKHGIIQNKVLGLAGVVGIIANAIYYLAYAKYFVIAFALNFTVMILISIVFYVLHIWAAGDSKLLILTVFLIPARFYFDGNNVAATVVIMIIIFSIAFLYVIGESICLGIKEKNLFQIGIIKTDIRNMIKQYIKCTCLVTLLGIFLRLIIPEFYEQNIELIMIINMVVVLLSYNIKLFDKIIPLLILILVTIVCFVFTVSESVNINFKIYPLVLVVMILRMIAEKYNYKTIPTSNVEKGMVLSYSTVMFFTPSSIKGLPHATTEDIRSKINDDEVESIKRWEHSKYGQPTITIVRKIPFAIFISIGTVIYTLVRMLIN